MIARRFLALALLTLTVLAPSAAAQSNDVTVELDQFGVGSWFRPGDVTAIRLKLTSSLNEATACWVQWEVPNAEGDPAEYGRSITLTPGTPALVWLYAPLPVGTNLSSTWTVRVFEESEGKRQGEIGGTRISPSLASTQPPVSPGIGLIAVIGRGATKLDDYLTPSAQQTNPPGAHEQTLIVSVNNPARLPDRWDGLRQFEAIVWSGASPQELRASSAAALEEYIRRGGHLIITLPSAGNPWALGRGGVTDLDPLLPQQAPRKDEAVLVSELLPVLSKSDRAARDFEVSIRVFKEIGLTFDAIDNHYEPLIVLPDGRVVVIQRTYGHGRITIIGLDLSSGRLASMGLPEADVFWNRVLGRRSDTPGARELKQMQDQDLLARAVRDHRRIGDGRLFENQLSATADPTLGILAAGLLFLVYFFAGPVSFIVLKQRRLTRHSWLVFAAIAGLFTAVAWAGVGVLREHNIQLRHVTVLDYLARPADDPRLDELHLQRAASWLSLYVPSYGTAGVSIDSDPNQRDLLLTWSAPEKAAQRFPNVAPYRIDVGKSPAEYEIPSRASVSQLYASWLGALDPQWGGMIRVDPNDPLRVQRDARGERDERLVGSIIHDLPGNLENVLIVWVTNNRLPRRRWAKDGDTELPWVPALRSGKALNIGHMWAIGRAWAPQVPFSFSSDQMRPSGQTGFERNTQEMYIKEYAGNSLFSGQGVSTPLREKEVRRHLEMLSFFHQITPPKYHATGGRQPKDNLILTRQLGRELDLSAWLTRPCLIVIGWLRDSACPIPLQVDGEPPNSSGLTIVRWIYPLPLTEAQVTSEPAGD